MNRVMRHIAVAVLACATMIDSATGSEAAAPPDADRKAILAMTGDFDVTFDLREILSLRAGYSLAPAKLEHGQEIVRVVEDTVAAIKLQHLLVMQVKEKTLVIKHWRQDWTYEPASLITYTGSGVWTVHPTDEADRRRRWSQTVW